MADRELKHANYDRKLLRVVLATFAVILPLTALPFLLIL